MIPYLTGTIPLKCGTMPKVGKLLPADKKEVARKNGIPHTTVYNRLRAGWSVEDAITKPSQKRKIRAKRNEDGVFESIGKGKGRAFTLDEEWETALEKAIADSGLSQSEWVEKVVIGKLKRSKYAKLKSVKSA